MAVPCHVDQCGFAHHGGSGDDFGCKEKSERSGASYEIRAHQPHHGLTRYAKGQRDSSLSRDDLESNLTQLPCYRRIVFFSEITRNDGSKNRVKSGLKLLRQGSHLLRTIRNADDIGRGEKAQYRQIESECTSF